MTTGSLPYKWIALSNTTLGMLMATVNASIMRSEERRVGKECA